MSQEFTGINIQFPISREILSGRKIIETRTYRIPTEYVGKTLLIVETPGPNGKFKSRIVAKICFSRCFQYESEDSFYADSQRHLVEPGSPWAWNPDKPKWGWVIAKVTPLKHDLPVRKRLGIKFTKGLYL